MRQMDFSDGITELLGQGDNTFVADSTSHSPSSGNGSSNGDSSPPGGGRVKRVARTTFTKSQLEGLEKRFLLQTFLAKDERRQLAQELGLTERQVMIWFQNRRGRLKRRGPADSAYSQEKLRELTGRRPYPFLYGLLASLPLRLPTPHGQPTPQGHHPQLQQHIQGYPQYGQQYAYGLPQSGHQPGQQHVYPTQTYGQAPPAPGQYGFNQSRYGTTQMPACVRMETDNQKFTQGIPQGAYIQDLGRHQSTLGSWFPHPPHTNWPTPCTPVIDQRPQPHIPAVAPCAQTAPQQMTSCSRYVSPGPSSSGQVNALAKSGTNPTAKTTNPSPVPTKVNECSQLSPGLTLDAQKEFNNNLVSCAGKSTSVKTLAQDLMVHDLDPYVVEIPAVLELPDIMSSLRAAPTGPRGQAPLFPPTLTRHHWAH